MSPKFGIVSKEQSAMQVKEREERMSLIPPTRTSLQRCPDGQVCGSGLKALNLATQAIVAGIWVQMIITVITTPGLASCTHHPNSVLHLFWLGVIAANSSVQLYLVFSQCHGTLPVRRQSPKMIKVSILFVSMHNALISHDLQICFLLGRCSGFS